MYSRVKYPLSSKFKEALFFRKNMSSPTTHKQPNIETTYNTLLANTYPMACNFIHQTVDYWAKNPNHIAFRSDS